VLVDEIRPGEGGGLADTEATMVHEREGEPLVGGELVHSGGEGVEVGV
jgi:hypothetical protein